MKRYDRLVLISLVAIFSLGIFMTARSAFSSYSTFAEANEHRRTAQVKGVAVDGSWRESGANSYTFELKDMAGQSHIVARQGFLPPNLFEAEYVVVIGRFEGAVFAARNILVKCPTRYMQESTK